MIKKERWIFISLGIIAISGALLGYGGLSKIIIGDPYHSLKEDLHFIVDQIQLWYFRPVEWNGGGESFLGLDLRLIGLPGEVDRFRWKSANGTFEITGLEENSFDLLITASDGQKFTCTNITSDTYPIWERLKY